MSDPSMRGSTARGSCTGEESRLRLWNQSRLRIRLASVVVVYVQPPGPRKTELGDQVAPHPKAKESETPRKKDEP